MARAKSDELLMKYTAQKRISLLWFVSSFIIILLFVIFTITNRFGQNNGDAWQWILQQLIPVLTLIISTFISSQQDESDGKKVKIFHYRIAYFLSLGYFMLLSITILAMPFASSISSISGYTFLKTSSVYLIPFLGLVTAALGMFFLKEEK